MSLISLIDIINNLLILFHILILNVMLLRSLDYIIKFN